MWVINFTIRYLVQSRVRFRVGVRVGLNFSICCWSKCRTIHCYLTLSPTVGPFCCIRCQNINIQKYIGENNNNNIGHLYCAVPILMYSTAHYIITDILLPRLYPSCLWVLISITRNNYIPAGYPFTTPGLRETIVDKMSCLRAYAPSGIRTHDPVITSREHEPLHHRKRRMIFFFFFFFFFFFLHLFVMYK